VKEVPMPILPVCLINKLILTFKMEDKLTAAAGCDKSVFPA
jgi:hypothetical protein